LSLPVRAYSATIVEAKVQYWVNVTSDVINTPQNTTTDTTVATDDVITSGKWLPIYTVYIYF